MKMKITGFLTTLIRIAGMLCLSFSLAAEESAEFFLQQKLENINSLSVNFNQTVQSRQGRNLQENRGRFKVTEDGHFLWETFEPFPQLILSDSITIWVYDPDLEQVTIKTAVHHSVNTPMMMFSGDKAAFLENFTIKYSVNEQGLSVFRLEPEQTDNLFLFLEVFFADDKPVKLLISDSLQQITTLSFSEVDINPQIDRRVFQFQIPDNVDIIDERVGEK
ncbi:MAG: outer membrane lipoprotein chaperone LolA [Pseudomonadales bacterium]|nr:outer membrane lipoprotein chaperone LolA [Pseudomonadales bacterium]